jgi:hypothetical protein
MRATSPVRIRDQPAGHSNVTVLSSRRRANSDESVNSYESGRDASKKCKEAGGAQDSIWFNANDNKEKDEEDEEADEADEIEDDADEAEAAELTLLRQEMDALEHRMYSTGTVASVFARIITQSRLTKKTLGAEALAAMKDIFHGNENPDPGGLHPVASPSENGPRDLARRPNHQPDCGI